MKAMILFAATIGCENSDILEAIEAVKTYFGTKLVETNDITGFLYKDAISEEVKKEIDSIITQYTQKLYIIINIDDSLIENIENDNILTATLNMGNEREK